MIAITTGGPGFLFSLATLIRPILADRKIEQQTVHRWDCR
jgi:hypothetical protein